MHWTSTQQNLFQFLPGPLSVTGGDRITTVPILCTKKVLLYTSAHCLSFEGVDDARLMAIFQVWYGILEFNVPLDTV